MPTKRKGEALRKQRGEDEGDVTLTEEESVAERGHVDDAARAGSRPTSQPAPQIPTDFLSTLIETITRAQVEANRSLINTLMTSSGDFRASTPVGISSSNATSADDLLYKARIAEDTYKASKVKSDPVNNNKSTDPPAVTTTDRDLTQLSSATTNATTSRCSNRNRPRCNYCKLFGHVSDECRNREKSTIKFNSNNRELRCYGCGKQGVVRSKCDVCAKTISKPNDKTSFNIVDVDFCSKVENNSYASPSDIDSCVNITNISTRDNHPMVNISVAGRGGVAIIDTGATHSIASPLLHRVLVDSGVHFTETKRFVRLADGSQGWRDLLSAEVEVSIKGRRVTCQFLVLPGSDIRTLLGIDFLTRAGMVIDVARRTWSFSDSPGQPYDFVYTYTLDSADTGLLHTTSSSELSLRSDEGCKLNSEQRRALNAFIEERAPQFAREGPATEFAAHRIKVSPQQEPIACPPYQQRLQLLFLAKVVQEA
ncbi:hypothetical protein HF086_010087 [Spodoptera exigua]|uniref:CCHC-type domain-containing protein n=1 Tax=Spodoptera exigua TaxID=7107 RepID=A0A922ST92_SPOEX|nr:hypothetical protein HF086_010087 [Spodoptera exigua]